MSWSTPFVHAKGNGSTGSGGTNQTGNINTTGATLIVISVATDANTGFTLSDSASNTWTKVASYGPSIASYSNEFITFFYCISPTTSATHNFTVTGTYSAGSAAIFVQAYNASGTITLDQNTGSAYTSSQSSIAPGSITPSTPNQLVISAMRYDGGGHYSPFCGSGFTVTDSLTDDYDYQYGGGMAYLLQGSAAAVNPSWTWSNGNTSGSAWVGSFKLVAAGPTINTQPTNQTAKIGATATFTAAATASAGSLTAQWQKNATNISGATNPTTYTTPPVSQGDNGATFDCVYTDSNGSVTTSTATLTVAPDTAAGPFFYQLLGSNHV